VGGVRGGGGGGFTLHFPILFFSINFKLIYESTFLRGSVSSSASAGGWGLVGEGSRVVLIG